MGRSKRPAQAERRKHKRHELDCPVSLAGQAGGEPVRTRGINISDGGMLFPIPPDAAPPPGQEVDLEFSIPRSTPNTFLLEPFRSRAIVVRQEPSDGEGPVRVAVRFEPSLDLGLEV